MFDRVLDLQTILFVLSLHKQLTIKCFESSEATAQRCSVKKDISQNSQENTCARVSFLISCMLHTFFTEHLRWLLLKVSSPIDLLTKNIKFLNCDDSQVFSLPNLPVLTQGNLRNPVQIPKVLSRAKKRKLDTKHCISIMLKNGQTYFKNRAGVHKARRILTCVKVCLTFFQHYV